jgi:O-antigen ligase
MVASSATAFFLALRSSRWWQKALALLASALMAHIPLLSFSRGGMLALIATALAAFVVLPKRPGHYLLFAAATLLVLRLAGPEVQQQFFTSFAAAEERDKSDKSRIELWALCVDTMQRKPLLGVGPGHWGRWVKEAYQWQTGQEAHNLWLQVGAEMGVAAMLLLMVFYVSALVRLVPLCIDKAAANPEAAGLARLVVPAIIGFLMASQFITSEGIEAPYYITLIGAGVLKLTTPPTAVEALAASSAETTRDTEAAPAGPVLA